MHGLDAFVQASPHFGARHTVVLGVMEILPTLEEFQILLDSELSQFSSSHRKFANSTLIKIRSKELRWEYGNLEPFDSWVFADFRERSVGAAYCRGGHGALGSPWGLVFFDQDSFGMDSGWYPTLYELYKDGWLLDDA